MKVVDVVVATGGGAMVKSAYSSGKPSFGVGAGNVPVIIDRDVDLKDAADKIVTGASFDNGIICSHEQFVLTPEEQYDETVEVVRRHRQGLVHRGRGAGAEVPRPRVPGRPPEQGRRRQVGTARSARWPASTFPRAARIILLPAEGRRHGRRAGEGEALPGRRDPALQDVRGSRRARPRPTCSSKAPATRRRVHSNNEAHIRAAGVELPVSRLVVNQPSSLTAGGSLTNGFAPTTTLGCGSWGGNSISENLDYKHLMNVSRIGKVITNKKCRPTRRSGLKYFYASGN